MYPTQHSCTFKRIRVRTMKLLLGGAARTATSAFSPSVPILLAFLPSVFILLLEMNKHRSCVSLARCGANVLVPAAPKALLLRSTYCNEVWLARRGANALAPASPNSLKPRSRSFKGARLAS